MKRSALFALPLAIAVALTACSQTTRGISSPVSPRTSSTAAVELPGYGAPKVEHPLDITHFRQVPCDTLTVEQVRTFIGTEFETRSDPNAAAGPRCMWTPVGDNTPGMWAAFPNLSDRGLTTLYYNRHDYAFFEETPPASGYPSLAYDLVDRRADGACIVRVGTSDQETLDVSVWLGDRKVGVLDPCKATHQVASAAVKTIKARN
ncbi:hypothetical protein SacmaDRAFT_0578 [Saccharomonospora marina XMU15]|uniref:DUF3558 domain-containing protein n=1 Tax=Saccharomonospora marina XMU15 TaxID=882083 RepID=H5X4D6_9PSEU|nr:DUF3558 domain-containing protein [Saccharomonospora marina]EHR48879.1 hypothetical protein SacmaDRAFT_0578 [Saccharomonospora marina XMU15]